MKHLFLRLLLNFGFVRLWCYLRRNKITILTLHGVMDKGVPSAWAPLRPRTSRGLFDETLNLATKYFTFVTLDEATAMLRGDIPVTPNSCVITFDDGQLNNLKIALPILRKYRIPVVFYPTTGMLEKSKPFWFDRLDYAIQQPGLNGVKVRVGQTEVKINQSSRREMALSLYKLIRRLKRQDWSDREFQKEVHQICEDLETVTDKRIDDIAKADLWSARMSKQDLQACADMEGVTLGSHTIRHVRLPYLEKDEELEHELKGSKATLEQLTGKPCHHFCYPNGDWDRRSAQAVQAAGYMTAVTTEVGSNAVGDDLYTLRRYSFPVTGKPLKGLFAITGISHFISKMRSE